MGKDGGLLISYSSKPSSGLVPYRAQCSWGTKTIPCWRHSTDDGRHQGRLSSQEGQPGLPGSHRSHIPTGHTFCLCMTAVCCSAASLSRLPDLSSQPLQLWKQGCSVHVAPRSLLGYFYSSGSPPWIFTSSPREESSFLWLFTLEAPMACLPPGSSCGNAPHRGGDNTVAGPEPQEACVLWDQESTSRWS